MHLSTEMILPPSNLLSFSEKNGPQASRNLIEVAFGIYINILKCPVLSLGTSSPNLGSSLEACISTTQTNDCICVTRTSLSCLFCLRTPHASPPTLGASPSSNVVCVVPASRSCRAASLPLNAFSHATRLTLEAITSYASPSLIPTKVTKYELYCLNDFSIDPLLNSMCAIGYLQFNISVNPRSC